MVWWPRAVRKPRLRLSHIRVRAPPKPSLSSLFLVTLLFIAFTLGGGVFMYINIGESWLAPILTISGVDTALWPGLDRQLLLEGIAAMLFVCSSFAGQLIVYQSSKYAYKRDYAQRLLILGWGITYCSYVVLWWMLATKIALLGR